MKIKTVYSLLIAVAISITFINPEFSQASSKNTLSRKQERSLSTPDLHNLSRAESFRPNTPRELRTQPNIISREQIQDLKYVADYIYELVQNKGVPTDEILVILDVDGTLTNYSNPEDYWIHDKIPPRPRAIELVQFLSQMNIQFIASSAHDNFSETLKKIKDLGLADEFHLSDDPILKRFMPQFSANYVKAGHVISVKTSGETYYSKKLLAPLALFTPEQLSRFRRIFLIDDYSKLKKVATKDINQYEPFNPKLVTYYFFNLTAVGKWPEGTDSSNHKQAQSKIDHFRLHTVSPYGKELFQDFISEPKFNTKKYNKELIQRIINELPDLSYLFKGKNTEDPNTGTSVTVKNHSLAVLEAFDEMSDYYLINTFTSTKRKRIAGLMKTTIALHDIGKRLSRKSFLDQHAFTLPILRHSLNQLGFLENEVILASNLVNSHVLSDFARSRISKLDAAEQLEAEARSSGVSLSLYYQLLCPFYLADATFYTDVQKHFKKKEGRWMPRDRAARAEWLALESMAMESDTESTSNPPISNNLDSNLGSLDSDETPSKAESSRIPSKASHTR